MHDGIVTWKWTKISNLVQQQQQQQQQQHNNNNKWIVHNQIYGT